MKANKKKIIVLVSMVLLLVATGVLNYFLNVKSNDTVTPGDTVTPTFFEQCRSYRLEIRELELETLNDIIATSADAEIIAQAEQDKLTLAKLMETEMVIETLIKAKGFDDAVVTISEKVNVVVKHDNMTTELAVQIHDIIVSETEYTSGDIIITPYV